MSDHAHRASDLTPEQLKRIQDACLLLITSLGAYREDLVLVGGLVPSLLIDTLATPDEFASLHPGSTDFDIALSLGLLHEERYHGLSQGLRDAGFAPDRNAAENETPQRWTRGGLTVDFLIAPPDDEARASSVQHIETDFAAYVIPGLDLAFRDRERVTIERIVEGEQIKRDLWVCGPAAYLVLKALAFDNRALRKDAYDLYYVLSRFGSGVQDVVARFRPLMDDPATQQALEILRRDFSDANSPGPVRAARFLDEAGDENLQADVAGTIRRFLALLDEETLR